MAATCATCAHPVTCLTMTVDGRPATCLSCGPCGVRTWTIDGSVVALADILPRLRGRGLAKAGRA